MRTGRKEHTMAAERMTLVDVLRKGEDPEVDFLCEGMRWLIQQLMETEVSAQIGAERYQRSDERTTQRNGYRTRPWDTRLGTLELAIPRLRTGSYFPRWLEPRRRAGQGLVAVVAESYMPGVSTRQGEALVQSMRILGLSEDVALWRAFQQDLVARGVRGVRGVRLVTSAAHAGLKQAFAEVSVGTAWMRCKVHFLRNLLARVPRTAQSMVAATVRSIFEQP